MSTTEELTYEHAAVAADSRESSKIGTSIMRDHGGSAVDAAIAAVLCSGVVNAHSCGIGGGSILTYYQKKTGKVYTINGRGKAPVGLRKEVYTDEIMPHMRMGGLSICVPGEILCLYEAWKLGGRLPWKQLCQPAVDLCRHGIKVRKAMANAMDELMHNDSLHLKERVPTFIDFLTNPKTGEIYKEGDVMYRPRLARTLEIIANEGPESFYNGSLTEDILADIKEANGLLTKEDLVNFTAPIKPPVILKLNEELTVYSPPLPSSGIVYQFILNILKGFNLDETSVSTTEKAITTWHRITEAFKHAAALKHRLGDGDIGTQTFKEHMNEVQTMMADSKFAESKRQKIVDSKTFDLAYYEPSSSGENISRHGTSHLSVLGPEGDAVAVTSTVSLYFGSKVVGNRTGIVFNDIMRNFSIPNTKHRYGRPPSFENMLEPLKSPVTSMCPSIIVDKEGDVKLVIGASGANRIPTAIALVVFIHRCVYYILIAYGDVPAGLYLQGGLYSEVTMQTLWFNWDIKKAIDYPRIHHQLYPPKICIQPGFPQEMLNGLKRIGHEVTDVNSISVVQGILRKGNKITAYSDPRKEGKQDGY